MPCATTLPFSSTWDHICRAKQRLGVTGSQALCTKKCRMGTNIIEGNDAQAFAFAIYQKQVRTYMTLLVLRKIAGKKMIFIFLGQFLPRSKEVDYCLDIGKTILATSSDFSNRPLEPHSMRDLIHLISRYREAVPLPKSTASRA